MLHAVVGPAARDALCSAFDGARRSIDAAFYSLDDPRVIDSLERAAARGCRVSVAVEGDPHRYGVAQAERTGPEAARRVARLAAEYHARFDARVDVRVVYDPRTLMHEKAAVIDGRDGYVATANATVSGARDAGDTLVSVHGGASVAALRHDIDASTGGAASGGCIVAGPGASLRARLESLLHTRADARISVEALSDARIASSLCRRAARGHRDRVLLGPRRTWSPAQRAVVARLVRAGVSVRAAHGCHIHDKFIDAGARVYVGSANLTFDGLDRAREVGVIAGTGSFDDQASALRIDFEQRWERAQPAGAA